MEHVLHTHWLFIGLYLLFYLIKCVLFLTGSPRFASWRKKTLVPENIFAVGFLATGIVMMVQLIKHGNDWMADNGWFHMKLTLVVLAIPLGIIGFKKENKALVAVSLLFFLYVLGIALTKSATLF
jgi:uncharacterized membrane protein SirB2